MKLNIFKDARARVPSTRLIRLLELVADEEADPDWSSRVNLIFTTDGKIRKLNRQFRSLNKVTDVLSFNLDEPSAPDGTFGEVYISVAAATRQASVYRVTPAQEYLRLACHGFLHLFGYDHTDPARDKDMRAREEYFLERLRKDD